MKRVRRGRFLSCFWNPAIFGRSISPRPASSRFPDPKLQSQLRDYLAVLNQLPGQDRRSVYIDATRERRARTDGQLYDAVAGVEIQLPSDVRRARRSDTRRVGHRGQHFRRGLDQRPARRGFGQAGFVYHAVYEPRYVQRPICGTRGESRGESAAVSGSVRSKRRSLQSSSVTGAGATGCRSRNVGRQ